MTFDAGWTKCYVWIKNRGGNIMKMVLIFVFALNLSELTAISFFFSICPRDGS